MSVPSFLHATFTLSVTKLVVCFFFFLPNSSGISNRYSPPLASLGFSYDILWNMRQDNMSCLLSSELIRANHFASSQIFLEFIYVPSLLQLVSCWKANSVSTAIVTGRVSGTASFLLVLIHEDSMVIAAHSFSHSFASERDRRNSDPWSNRRA